MFVILCISASAQQSYPQYNWNNAKLGVSIGDRFEFKLSEYREYFTANDGWTQRSFILNPSAPFGQISPDEELEVGESFTVTINSNSFFLPSNYTKLQEGTFTYNIGIPQYNVIISQNSFSQDRVMQAMISYGGIPFISPRILESLFFVGDWGVYQLIYSPQEYYNETIVNGRANIEKFKRNFTVGEETVIYEEESLIDVIDASGQVFYENYYIHAVIDLSNGIITKLDRHFALEGGLTKLEIEFEFVKKLETTTNSKSGSETPIFASIVSLSIFITTFIRKHSNH